MLGHVLIGLRLAIGIVWIVLVPCEMLGVSAGLGYFILDTRDRLAYSELTAVVLIIGLLGFLAAFEGGGVGELGGQATAKAIAAVSRGPLPRLITGVNPDVQALDRSILA